MGQCQSNKDLNILNYKNKNIFYPDAKLMVRYRIVKEKSSTIPHTVFNVKIFGTTEIRILKKLIPKKNDEETLRYNRNILEIYTAINHPQIPNIREAFQSESEIGLIFDKIQGKRIPEYFEFKKTVDFQIVCTITFQLINLLDYLHKKQICLRALDPKNILFDGTNIKLISLNNARSTKRNFWFSDLVGEPYLMSPEMANGKYSYKNDIWQAGVIIHELLIGEHVVTGTFYDEVARKLKGQDYDIDRFKILQIDPELKEVILEMLKENDRKSTTELLQLKFFKTIDENALKLSRKSTIITNRLSKTFLQDKFQILLFKFLVRQAVTEKDRLIAFAEFQKYDPKNTGFISKNEFIKSMNLKIPEENDNIQLLLNSGEIPFKENDDKDKKIDFNAFLTVWVGNNNFYDAKKIKGYFEILDADRNGYISCAEFEKILTDEKEIMEFRKMIKTFSPKDNIDLKTFIKYVKNELKTHRKASLSS